MIHRRLFHVGLLGVTMLVACGKTEPPPPELTFEQIEHLKGVCAAVGQYATYENYPRRAVYCFTDPGRYYSNKIDAREIPEHVYRERQARAQPPTPNPLPVAPTPQEASGNGNMVRDMAIGGVVGGAMGYMLGRTTVKPRNRR